MDGWGKTFHEDKKGKHIPIEASYGGVLYYPHWDTKLALVSGITPPSANNWDSIHACNMEHFDNQKTVSSISLIGEAFKTLSEDYKKDLEGSQKEADK